MICRPEDVLALFTGELRGEQARAMTEHLENCRECRRLREDLQEIARDMEAMATQSLEPEELDAMFARATTGPPLVVFKAPTEPGIVPASDQESSRRRILAVTALVAVTAFLMLLSAALGMVAWNQLARPYATADAITSPRNSDSGVAQNTATTAAANAGQTTVEVSLRANQRSTVVSRTLPTGTQIIWNYQ